MIAELHDAASALAGSGRPPAQLAANDFAPRALAPLLADVRARLERGLGFVLLRGVPVRELGKEASALAYYWLGLQLGAPVSQNTSGDLLGHVRDTGAKPSDHDVRLYKTRAELAFHTDGADIIGLLCLRSGRSGGVSRIASSPFVFNEIVRRRPDLAPLLLRTYQHHAHGQYGPNGPKTFGLPIVTLQPNLATNQINGSIDEVGVWHRVLSDDEIDYLYNNGAGRTLFGELSIGVNADSAEYRTKGVRIYP